MSLGAFTSHPTPGVSQPICPFACPSSSSRWRQAFIFCWAGLPTTGDPPSLPPAFFLCPTLPSLPSAILPHALPPRLASCVTYAKLCPPTWAGHTSDPHPTAALLPAFACLPDDTECITVAQCHAVQPYPRPHAGPVLSESIFHLCSCISSHLIPTDQASLFAQRFRDLSTSPIPLRASLSVPERPTDCARSPPAPSQSLQPCCQAPHRLQRPYYPPFHCMPFCHVLPTAHAHASSSAYHPSSVRCHHAYYAQHVACKCDTLLPSQKKA